MARAEPVGGLWKESTAKGALGIDRGFVDDRFVLTFPR